ncbi:hypothetical protein D1BOALGB6SA_6927 [Olavius sp. associated proteobacterium Delta 1]|nr:hypothetical protein D1BOALGB6SA_6927 [Olavius sp. associated proteobacterium Delta 1]
MKEIIVEVTFDGEVRIETKGFTGKSCLSEAQFIKDVLGKETARQLTPTYWQNDSASVKKYLPICG